MKNWNIMKKIQHILSILLLPFVAMSCSNELDIDSNQGYLALSINTAESTYMPGSTRADAPEDYAPKTLSVSAINEQGKTVWSTEDYANSEANDGKIILEAGTYTIVAHSANWDGNGSGFDVPYYYGSTKVTIEAKTMKKASIKCTLANVKLTVNYDQSIKDNFKSAITRIASEANGANPLDFVMGQTTKSGYIPADNFNYTLLFTNNSGMKHDSICQTISNVQPRDHYIFNIKLVETGGDEPGGDLPEGEGYASIVVDIDYKTNTYTYTYPVPKKPSVSLETKNAHAWSTFAYLNASVNAKTSNFDNSNLYIEYRKIGEENWTKIENADLTIDAKDNVTAVLKGLDVSTKYEYRLCYATLDDVIVADPISFTTEAQTVLYNGGFEHWHQSGNPWYPNESGVKFWDTSNPGSTTIGASYNVTTRTESPKRSGSYAAKLESTKVVIKFAAASMYTGVFGATIGTSGAWLTWGTPFACRPTALKGYMQYHPKAIDNTGSGLPAGAPGKGDSDMCSIYFALLTETIRVDNTDMSTFPNWETDPRVVAYGALPDNQCVATGDTWKEINIPLVYHNVNKKPTHLLVVFSASKYGDYFHGAKGSTLYLDDFSLEYGEEPTVR